MKNSPEKPGTVNRARGGQRFRYVVSSRDGILRFRLAGGLTKVAKPTVFLDRDGVLNRRIDGGYVTRWADFVLLPGVVPALRQLHHCGFQLIIVSNQAGVAKGVLQRETLEEITRRSLQQFQAGGGQIDAAFFCLHQPSDLCECRKPKPGLLRAAARSLPIDFSRSFLIGDSLADVLAGTAVGCATVYLTHASSSEVAATHQARTLGQAVQWIRRRSGC